MGYWAIDNQAEGYNSDNYIAKLWARVDQRCRKEAMAGTTLRIVPSRPGDYLGIGFGLYKGADTAKLVNEHEKVLEFTYNLQVNSNITVAPYYQIYFNPAYRTTSTVSAAGVQAHLSF